MECPICGNDMEMIFYEDEEGKYVTWVCYVCEANKIEGELDAIGT